MTSCKECHYYQEGGELLVEEVPFCSKLNIKYPKEGGEECEFFKESLWEDRETLLEMGRKAIMEKYNISRSYVGAILAALQRERFDVLVEDSLSIAEKAEALDVCGGSVRAYYSALKKVNMR